MRFQTEQAHLEFWEDYTNRGRRHDSKVVKPSELDPDRLVAAELFNYGDYGEYAVFEFESIDGRGGTVSIPMAHTNFRSWLEVSKTRDTALESLTEPRRRMAIDMAHEYRHSTRGPLALGYFGSALGMMQNSISHSRPLHHFIWSTSHCIEGVDVSSIKDAAIRWYGDTHKTFWRIKKVDDHYLEWAAATLFWIESKQQFRDQYKGAVWKKLKNPCEMRLAAVFKQVWR